MADTPGEPGRIHEVQASDTAATFGDSVVAYVERVSIPELPKKSAIELPTGVIRYRLVLAVLAFALLVLGGEAFECAKYCKDVHDVRELYDPFQSAAIALLGSAVAYYFTDRNNRST